jgi:hypothetical protein
MLGGDEEVRQGLLESVARGQGYYGWHVCDGWAGGDPR